MLTCFYFARIASIPIHLKRFSFAYYADGDRSFYDLGVTIIIDIKYHATKHFHVRLLTVGKLREFGPVLGALCRADAAITVVAR